MPNNNSRTIQNNNDNNDNYIYHANLGCFLIWSFKKSSAFDNTFPGETDDSRSPCLPPGLSAAVWMWGGVQMGKNV